MNSISIVLPVHNERDNLEKLISSWNSTLNSEKVDHEFILVEDGSTDGTKELIVKLEKEYPITNLSQSKKRGYSQAVIDGIYSAKKDYILCTDSDNQIKVSSLVENLNKFPKINEFLIGYRNPRNDPINRLIYSKLFKIFHDLIFKSKLKDPSCPFVIGMKESFRKLDKHKMLYMKEGFWWGFIGVCKIQKCFIKQVPIDHYKRETGQAGYKIKDLPGIIFRNIVGILKIKYLN